MSKGRETMRARWGFAAALGAAGLSSMAGAQVTLTPVVVEGVAVAGLPAGYMAVPIGNARIAANGVLLIPASLSGPGIDPMQPASVELTGSGAMLSVVMSDQMVIPGAPAGFLVSMQTLGAMTTSNGSATAAIMLTDPNTFDSTTAYWLGMRGANQTVAGTPLRIFGLGDAAPAPLVNATISSVLGLPSITSGGRYGGLVGLAGAGVTGINNQAMLTGTAGSTPLVAVRQGDSAPGIPANEPGGPAFIHFRDQTSINLNSGGQMLFRVDLVNGSGSGLPFNRSALYRYEPAGSLTLVAREGNSPGTGTLTFGQQVPNVTISMNASGAVAFQTQQGSGTGVFVIWAGAAASLSAVAQSNTQAPGLPTGVVYAATNGFSNAFDGVRISDSGSVAFVSVLTGTGVTSTNGSAVFAGVPGLVHSVVRAGDQAPGVASGVLFRAFSSVALNTAGRVAFVATDTEGGFGSGIWAQDSGGVLRKVVRAGDAIVVGGTPRTVSSVAPPSTGNGSDGLGCSFDSAGRVVAQVFFTDNTAGVFLASFGFRSDFNHDGVISVQDIFDFLAAWFGGSLAADFNTDGSLSVQDIFDFLGAWFAGL